MSHEHNLQPVYPPDLNAIYSAQTATYLTDIAPVEVFNAPKETITSPRAVIPERLGRIADAIRTIEASRRLIAYHGSVLKAVADTSPETIDRLPASQRDLITSIIGWMGVEGE